MYIFYIKHIAAGLVLYRFGRPEDGFKAALMSFIIYDDMFCACFVLYPAVALFGQGTAPIGYYAVFAL